MLCNGLVIGKVVARSFFQLVQKIGKQLRVNICKLYSVLILGECFIGTLFKQPLDVALPRCARTALLLKLPVQVNFVNGLKGELTLVEKLDFYEGNAVSGKGLVEWLTLCNKSGIPGKYAVI